MSAQPTSQATAPSIDLYARVNTYPWSTDPEFQGGLAAILGPNTDPSSEQATELALRARCFYYARKFNTNVDFDTYKAYLAGDLRPTNTNPASAIPSSRVSGEAGQVPAGGANSSNAGSVEAPAPTSGGTTAGGQVDAPYPTSFAHIVELITTGQPIPGVKEIPNTVLEGQGTQSTKTSRRKPWENDTENKDAALTTEAATAS